MASTKNQLKGDLARALRAKDEHTKTTIRALMAAISHEETAGKQPRELTDAQELAVLTREMRKRRESAATYAEAGRQDLAGREESEADFIATYLPAPLAEDELDAMVTEEVNRVRQSGQTPSMQNMGAVVRAVNERAAGRAEGAVVAAKVKSQLTTS